jgi:Rieske Fe-S protein
MTDAGRTTTRRTMVGGIVGLGVATPLLAACGGSDDASGSGGTGSSGGSGGSSGGGSGTTSSGAIAKTSDIPVGGGKIFSSEKVVVTQPTQGDFKAFSAVCTHQGCVVSEIKGDDIDCTCHGSKFSIKDGSVVNGPATKSLESLTATVKGQDITVS